jgi:hypothetical protein
MRWLRRLVAKGECGAFIAFRSEGAAFTRCDGASQPRRRLNDTVVGAVKVSRQQWRPRLGGQCVVCLPVWVGTVQSRYSHARFLTKVRLLDGGVFG